MVRYLNASNAERNQTLIRQVRKHGTEPIVAILNRKFLNKNRTICRVLPDFTYITLHGS